MIMYIYDMDIHKMRLVWLKNNDLTAGHWNDENWIGCNFFLSPKTAELFW